MSNDILGIDLVGVLMSVETREEIIGALEGLRRLVEERFGKNVWLVSAAKPGPDDQGRSEKWLSYHRFYERTGILPEHVRFCRSWDKVDVYRELKVTHVIDDAFSVLANLETVKKRYLFQSPDSVKALGEVEEPIEVVTSWTELLDKILKHSAC